MKISENPSYTWTNNEAPFGDFRQDFANYVETKLYWACNDCWCSPCECGSENY